MLSRRELILILFVVLTVLLRLIPHPPNIAPVTALAIFGATTFKNKYLGMLLPLIALGISDIFLGFSNISYWVYGAFILISLTSMFIRKVNTQHILLSSIVFFIVTNFGVWLLGYPNTVEGFILCYTLALPFFVNTVIGDLFFTYVLKHSFKLIESKLKLNYVS
jgi:hypothetical protein